MVQCKSHALLQTSRELIRANVVRALKTVPSSTASGLGGKSRFLSFMAGGTGLTTVAAVNYRHYWVRCNAADRITAVRVLRKKDGRFDWWRFWTYLRPHLLKFLGAICVRNLVLGLCQEKCVY